MVYSFVVNNELLVTAKELAKFFACTYQMVQNLTRAGVIQKAKNQDGSEMLGRYDLLVCNVAYIKHLRARAGVKGVPADQEAEARWQAARVARMETQARRDLLRLEREEGRLVDPNDVRPVWVEYIGNCKQKLLALPIRCANEIFVKQSDQAEVYRILTERVREALLELKDFSEHYDGRRQSMPGDQCDPAPGRQHAQPG
jgi:phage terminase Nu1 subunit (DNA packaging protein)